MIEVGVEDVLRPAVAGDDRPVDDGQDGEDERGDRDFLRVFDFGEKVRVVVRYTVGWLATDEDKCPQL